MTAHLCEYEIKILRVCAGEDVEGLCWGAAMSVALESLESAGLVRCTQGCYQATDKGRELLAVSA